MSGKRIQVPARVEDFFREHRTGRRRLFALTYEFDPTAFERTFSTILRWPVQVDVVAGKGVAGTGSGARYWGARWPGTFHPKVIALLANDHVCVGLGSANLTSGGLRDNLEEWQFFEGREDSGVLAGVRGFLTLLDNRDVLPGEVRIKEFIEALPKQSHDHPFLSTLRGPLIDQVGDRLGRTVRGVDIVSPINCDPSRVVARLRKIVGNTTYRLFTGDNPVPRIAGISEYFVLKRPDASGGTDVGRAVAASHAKMYAFRTGRHVDVFWGSANLSYSAWMATGNRANIDILLHSRVSESAWRSFLEKDLPPGHQWMKTQAKGAPPKAEVEESIPPWRLLHATVRRGRIILVADKDGKRVFRLRSQDSKRAFNTALTFRTGRATLPSAMGSGLGFLEGMTPSYLEWTVGSSGEWRKIPVNDLDSVPGVHNSADLAQQLFWEYSGRLFPRTGSRTGPSSSQGSDEDDALPPEEDELTRSNHQGELDRFILEWRSIARRVAIASGTKQALKRVHCASIIERVDAEARELPASWTPSRLAFVRNLLERKWRV